MSIELPPELIPLSNIVDDPTRRLAIMVGTGVSFAATGASTAKWDGLLLDGLEYCRTHKIGDVKTIDSERNLIEHAFGKSFDLEEVLSRADSLTKRLGGTGSEQFAAWLEGALGSLKTTGDVPVLDSLTALARHGAILMTTNYDDILCRATGLPPVTWEDPGAIIAAINGSQPAIIHVHGHWKRPSSLILGRTSYDRISEATTTQIALRSLWTLLPWLYVGCGSGGVDDPNLGALIRWGFEANLDQVVLSHFFLSTGEVVANLPAALAEASNTVMYAYGDHAQLPELLNALLPEARPTPFERLGPCATTVRAAGSSPLRDPRLSWDELILGQAPPLAADEVAMARLAERGWAVISDTPSKGKTTLAMRLAVRAWKRGETVYCLSLKSVAELKSGGASDPFAALARLTKKDVLFIVDDAHLQPAVARQLWDQWGANRCGSRMLLAVTRIDRRFELEQHTLLNALLKDPENTPIGIGLKADDMLSLARYVMLRTGTRWVEPGDPEVPKQWRKTFGGAIGAFVVAVSERRDALRRGDYSLPPVAAADWMFARHLAALDKDATENAVWMSVLGGPGLELGVTADSLPHPHKLNELLHSGLIEQTLGRVPRYSMRESSWGELVLSALGESPDRIAILAEAASRDPIVAGAVAVRLTSDRSAAERGRYWETLAANVGEVFDRSILSMPLPTLHQFILEADRAAHSELGERVWSHLESHVQEFATVAATAQPADLAGLVRLANSAGHGVLDALLWQQWNERPKDYLFAVENWPLEQVAVFVTEAKRLGCDKLLSSFWARLLDDSEILYDRVTRESPVHIASFLKAAAAQGQSEVTRRLWAALKGAEELIATRLAAGPFAVLRAFLLRARQQHQDTFAGAIVSRLADQSEMLASRMLIEDAERIIGVFVLIPSAQQRAIASHLDPADWGTARDGRRPAENAQLADKIAAAGRLDVADAIVKNILLRKNPKEFADHRHAIIDVSHTLRLASASNPDLVDAFVKKVCSPWMLDHAYELTHTKSLTHALARIALHQRPRVIRQFWRPGLYERLRRERPAADASPESLIEFISLLGAVEAIGMRIDAPMIASLSAEQLSTLPARVPVRPRPPWAERDEREFWLGMRTLARISPNPLYVDRELIWETLKRWQINVCGAEDWHGTAAVPDTAAHRLNLSMIDWFMRCHANGRGQLESKIDPLWMLVGFARIAIQTPELGPPRPAARVKGRVAKAAPRFTPR